MKKLSNTEAELKKALLIKKVFFPSMYFSRIFPETLQKMNPFIEVFPRIFQKLEVSPSKLLMIRNSHFHKAPLNGCFRISDQRPLPKNMLIASWVCFYNCPLYQNFMRYDRRKHDYSEKSCIIDV